MKSVDTSKWSGEGTFTQVLLERLGQIESIAFIRVEDAPASRSEADYNFMSNEIFVAFAERSHTERIKRFGVLPGTRTVTGKAMSMVDLELTLTESENIGAPDYSDEGMLQYLRSERIVPPYQTRGYKLVELVRIYEAGTEPRR
jgi:hypothetical protein